MANKRSNLAGALAKEKFLPERIDEVEGFAPIAIRAMAYKYFLALPASSRNTACLNRIKDNLLECCGKPGDSIDDMVDRAADIVKLGGAGSPQFEAAQIARKANQLKNVSPANLESKRSALIQDIKDFKARFKHILETSFGKPLPQSQVEDAARLLFELTAKIGGKKRKRTKDEHFSVMKEWALSVISASKWQSIDSPAYGNGWTAEHVLTLLTEDQERMQKARIPCKIVEYIKRTVEEADQTENVSSSIRQKLQVLLRLVDPEQEPVAGEEDAALQEVEQACAEKAKGRPPKRPVIDIEPIVDQLVQELIARLQLQGLLTQAEQANLREAVKLLYQRNKSALEDIPTKSLQQMRALEMQLTQMILDQEALRTVRRAINNLEQQEQLPSASPAPNPTVSPVSPVSSGSPLFSLPKESGPQLIPPSQVTGTPSSGDEAFSLPASLGAPAAAATTRPSGITRPVTPPAAATSSESFDAEDFFQNVTPPASVTQDQVLNDLVVETADLIKSTAFSPEELLNSWSIDDDALLQAELKQRMMAGQTIGTREEIVQVGIDISQLYPQRPGFRLLGQKMTQLQLQSEPEPEQEILFEEQPGQELEDLPFFDVLEPEPEAEPVVQAQSSPLQLSSFSPLPSLPITKVETFISDLRQRGLIIQPVEPSAKILKDFKDICNKRVQELIKQRRQTKRTPLFKLLGRKKNAVEAITVEDKQNVVLFEIKSDTAKKGQGYLYLSQFIPYIFFAHDIVLRDNGTDRVFPIEKQYDPQIRSQIISSIASTYRYIVDETDTQIVFARAPTADRDAELEYYHFNLEEVDGLEDYFVKQGGLYDSILEIHFICAEATLGQHLQNLAQAYIEDNQERYKFTILEAGTDNMNVAMRKSLVRLYSRPPLNMQGPRPIRRYTPAGALLRIEDAMATDDWDEFYRPLLWKQNSGEQTPLSPTLVRDQVVREAKAQGLEMMLVNDMAKYQIEDLFEDALGPSYWDGLDESTKQQIRQDYIDAWTKATYPDGRRLNDAVKEYWEIAHDPNNPGRSLLEIYQEQEGTRQQELEETFTPSAQFETWLTPMVSLASASPSPQPAAVTSSVGRDAVIQRAKQAGLEQQMVQELVKVQLPDLVEGYFGEGSWQTLDPDTKELIKRDYISAWTTATVDGKRLNDPVEEYYNIVFDPSQPNRDIYQYYQQNRGVGLDEVADTFRPSLQFDAWFFTDRHQWEHGIIEFDRLHPFKVVSSKTLLNKLRSKNVNYSEQDSRRALICSLGAIADSDAKQLFCLSLSSDLFGYYIMENSSATSEAFSAELKNWIAKKGGKRSEAQALDTFTSDIRGSCSSMKKVNVTEQNIKTLLKPVPRFSSKEFYILFNRTTEQMTSNTWPAVSAFLEAEHDLTLNFQTGAKSGSSMIWSFCQRSPKVDVFLMLVLYHFLRNPDSSHYAIRLAINTNRDSVSAYKVALLMRYFGFRRSVGCSLGRLQRSEEWHPDEEIEYSALFQEMEDLTFIPPGRNANAFAYMWRPQLSDLELDVITANIHAFISSEIQAK